MNHPKVTVITVCYNAAAEVEDTMRSVLNQTYDNLEYIIIDGASTDNTLSIIKATSAEYPHANVVIKSEPDKGIYDAMNKGIDIATGQWINFMNVGDSFVEKETLASFFEAADTQAPNDLLYGDTIMKYPFGSYYKDCRPGGKFAWFCHQSMFVRSEVMKKYHFDIQYTIAADLNFLIQVQRAGHKRVYCPKLVSVYKHYDGLSSSPVNWRKKRMELYLIEGNRKDLHYYSLAFKYLLQKYLHIRNYRINFEEKILKEVESDPRMRKIAYE